MSRKPPEVNFPDSPQKEDPGFPQTEDPKAQETEDIDRNDSMGQLLDAVSQQTRVLTDIHTRLAEQGTDNAPSEDQLAARLENQDRLLGEIISELRELNEAVGA